MVLQQPANINKITTKITYISENETILFTSIFDMTQIPLFFLHLNEYKEVL
jgi:hypothetical protein